MTKTARKPAYIKYRLEEGFGLVYDHEKYGYDDATLSTVDTRVVNCIDYVEANAPVALADLQAHFSTAVIDVAREKGYIDVT